MPVSVTWRYTGAKTRHVRAYWAAWARTVAASASGGVARRLVGVVMTSGYQFRRAAGSG